MSPWGLGGGERDTVLSRWFIPPSSPQRLRRLPSDPILRRPSADLVEKRDPRGDTEMQGLPFKPQSEKAVRQRGM